MPSLKVQLHGDNNHQLHTQPVFKKYAHVNIGPGISSAQGLIWQKKGRGTYGTVHTVHTFVSWPNP